MSGFSDAAQQAHAALDRIRDTATRLSPAARRELLNRLKELNARMDAAQQVDRWQRGTNHNGGHHIEDAALLNLTVEAPRTPNKDRSGGRRMIGTWHGEPIWEQEQDA